MRRISMDSPPMQRARKRRGDPTHTVDTVTRFVSDRQETGGRRKGKRMRKQPSEVKTAYLTRADLVKLPSNTEVDIDSLGRVHVARYSR